MNKKQKKLENESEKIMKQERQKEDTLSLGWLSILSQELAAA